MELIFLLWEIPLQKSQVQVPGEGMAELGARPSTQEEAGTPPGHGAARPLACTCVFAEEVHLPAVGRWIFNQHKDCIILFGIKVSFIGERNECVLLLSLTSSSLS